MVKIHNQSRQGAWAGRFSGHWKSFELTSLYISKRQCYWLGMKWDFETSKSILSDTYLPNRLPPKISPKTIPTTGEQVLNYISLTFYVL